MVTIEITGHLSSVSHIYGAMLVTGLIGVKQLRFNGYSLTYESEESAINSMRNAFVTLTEDGESITDGISPDGMLLTWDAAKAIVY